MPRRAAIAVMALLVAASLAVAACAGPAKVEVPPAADIAVGLDVAKSGAAARLGAAVRFKTVSRGPDVAVAGEAFLGLHDFLRQSYPKTHAALKVESVGDYSLLYTWQGRDAARQPILLLAHMDVVPIEPESLGAWRHPPFSGAIADGFVWGRGTLDDKVSVLATLEAIELLLADGFAPERTVYLAFGHDEEIDGRMGAARIAALLAERGVRLGFTLDEGGIIGHDLVPGVEPPVALIGVAEKGYLSLKLSVEAEDCGHSSMPPRTTAIGRLAGAIHRLESNPMAADLAPPVTDMFDQLAGEMPFMLGLAVSNRWLFAPLVESRLSESPASDAAIRTTTAVTMFNAGVKANVLPCAAEAVVNFRILPSDSIAAVTEHVRAVIDDPVIEISRHGAADEPSPVSDIASPGFAALQQTVRQIFPEALPAPHLVIAATDSKHFTAIADNSYRFLPIRLGPDDTPRIHGINERISLQNYSEVIRFYIQLLLNAAL
ncbi:MAG: M20 family peptidase [Alphaproteobacteria bacterium]|nr:M20 family peptidase [Alphaproteobacteria bacterium]MDP6817672.1 M20 family peptidase [Alphaproteobacteria bacterium]